MAASNITKTGARSYEFSNDRGEDLTLTLFKLGDDLSFTEVGTLGTVADSATLSFTLDEDGVYYINLAGATVNENCTINEYEGVILAFLAVHNSIICNCSCLKTKQFVEPRTYYMNAIMMEFFAFRSIVNSQSINNDIFTVLDSSSLQEMHTLSKIISKITELYACIDGTYVNLSTNNCNCC